MQHRFVPAVRSCAGIVMIALLAACGGGGGSSPAAPATTSPTSQPSSTPKPSPTPLATPAPGTVVLPGQQSSGGGAGGFVNNGKTPSTYAVSSNPSGLSFTEGGQTYKTPATITPTASTGALAIAFTGSTYSVPIVQVYDGPHTVYYNAASDSKGQVAVSSLQSLKRRSASISRRSTFAGVHRGVRGRAPHGSDVDSTRVAVRMSAAALRTSGRSPADVERAAGAAPGRDTLSATTDRLRIVNVPKGVDVATFTRSLQAQPEVAEVSAVHRRFLQARAATTVTDPYFEIPDQWYDFATGVNFAWSYDTGTGAKLAVIDTGIDDNNTDLTDQLAYQETDVTPIDNGSASGTCQPLSGATTVVTPGTAQDDNGHGTNVAGIALAQANTAGFAGAAFSSKLLAFKIFPNQNANCNNNSPNFGASTPDEAQAITDAIAQGADVISLSIGSDSFDQVEFNAVENAIAAGVTVVAAAGNGDDGSGAGTLDYPGAYPGVMAVGASALKDEYYTTTDPQNTGTYSTSTEIVASYSQYGPSLSVVAPGGDASPSSGSTNDDDILHWIENYSTTTAYLTADQCTDSNGAPSTPLNCIVLFNGTSQATPQVSATAALLVAEAGGHKSLTPAEVSYIIDSTADNINDPHQGHGRLNAYRALASLVRDTAAYSGPVPTTTGTAQLVAFAYAKSNTNRPAIIDASFPAGIPVNTDGSFEIGDVPAGTGSYRVAVWYDANGDGAVDAGDQIGVAGVTCSSTSVCAIGTITMQTVSTGYTLP